MKIFTITLLTICVNLHVNAQSLGDMSRYERLMSPLATDLEFSTELDFKNELTLILTGAFSFYKHYISSQDAVHCAFYPSCSVYAVETIKTNGFIGILDAIDRLTRCNGMSPEKYPIHEHTQRFYDPVRHLH